MSNPIINFAQDRRLFNEPIPAPQHMYQQHLQQPNRMMYQNHIQQVPTSHMMLHAQSGPAMIGHVVGMSGPAQSSMVLPSTEGNQSIPTLHQMNVGGNFQFQQQLQQDHQQQQQHHFSPDALRSFMDQKLQHARYEDQLRQRLVAAPADPLMQSPFIGDAGLLMGHPGMFGMNRAQMSLPSPHELSLRDDTRRMRGGVIEPFPEKLHRLLLAVEQAGRSDVISFIANGQAFAIHKPDKFFKEIVPKYFRQSRLSSFKRQLNLYGFELINTGPARGGYYHEMFIKYRGELCRRMRRVAVKTQHQNQQEEKGKNDEKEDENQSSATDFFDLPSGIKNDQINQNHDNSVDRRNGDTTINLTSAMSA